MSRWWTWLTQPGRRPCLVFAAISALVMGPMLLPGYILTLDMVFTPQLRWPEAITNTAPFFALLHLLNLVFPADFLQKVILFGILLASGIGGFRLVQYLGSLMKTYPQWLWISYAAGLLYMVNPFSYSRFMAGQYLVLIGYALLPFFVQLVLRWMRSKETKTVIKVAATAAVIGMLSIHSVGIIAVPWVAAVVICLWQVRRYPKQIKKMLIQTALIAGIFLGLSAFWLVPLIVGQGDTAAAVQQFSGADLEAFATTGSSSLGRISNILQLQGFWAEARNLYWLPQEVLALWPLAVLLLWVIVGTGVVQLWRQSKGLACFFGGTGLIGVVAASGILQPLLADIIPLLAGYREPQKFVALVVLAYIVFAAVGSAFILQRITQKQPALGQFWLVLVLILPVLLTPTMFWGLYGQLTPRQYPSDWRQLNLELRTSNGGEVLFLPWHQYMTFQFSDRIIVNPAEKYFDAPIIASDNPEIGKVAPTVPNEQKRQLESALIEAEQGGKSLAYQLTQHRIQYIVVAKEFDFERYRYLDDQDGIEKVSETATLKLYRNKLFNQE